MNFIFRKTSLEVIIFIILISEVNNSQELKEYQRFTGTQRISTDFL